MPEPVVVTMVTVFLAATAPHDAHAAVAVGRFEDHAADEVGVDREFEAVGQRVARVADQVVEDEDVPGLLRQVLVARTMCQVC